MLKFFFWVLLVANGLLFAYERGYFESVFPSGREPARLATQVNADKVRIVPQQASAPEGPGAAPAASSPAGDTTPAAAPAQQPAPQPQPPQQTPPAPATQAPAAPAATAPNAAPAAAPATSKPAVEKVAVADQAAAVPEKKSGIPACLEIGNFNPDDAKRFATQLKTAGLSELAKERSMQEVASHLVYIPPQTDREGADKKAAELRRLGITDFFIIQDNSPLRWGISLGVFKTEEAARNHLGALVQKGVRSARVGQRSVTANYLAYQFRALDAQKKWVIDKIKSGFPKQEERSCEGT